MKSVKIKFDEVAAEIIFHRPTIVCITETWLTSSSQFGLYTIDGYKAYFSSRSIKSGGGAMIFEDSNLHSQQLSAELTTNDAYNVCAIMVGEGSRRTTIAAVFKAFWALEGDTKELHQHPDQLCVKFYRIVIKGNFNMPGLTAASTGSCNYKLVDCLVSVHSLQQLACVPTRGNSQLDLIFVSAYFVNSAVYDVAPVGSSDHGAQLVALCASEPLSIGRRKRVDYERLRFSLGQIDWNCFFLVCTGVDDYISRLTGVLVSSVETCTYYRPMYKSQRLPRHVV